MEIENRFAAEVANARGNARLANTAGIPQTVSDQLVCALADLWECELSHVDIQAIVDRYVEYDDEGAPWPRALPETVTPWRR